MNNCTKRLCPLMNPSECRITPLECPYYTNESNEKFGKSFSDIAIELILRIKRRGAIDVLQEIKNQIGEKHISRDEVLKLIDEKINEYSE